MSPLKKCFLEENFLMIHLTDQQNHTVIDSSTNVKQDDSLLGFCIWIDSSSFAKVIKEIEML